MSSWKKVKETVVHQGYRGISQKRFEMPNGQLMDFDIVTNEVYVTIAAFTPEKAAILVRQFRPGPEQMLVSFPEGALEEGESAIEAGRRELLEETGYQAGTIEILKTFRSAYTTEKQICLLALDCQKMTSQNLDESEYIEVFTLPLVDFRHYLRDKNDEAFTNVDAAYLALDRMDSL
ncbi:MAG: NUDIX hydrolase [Bacteroidota bacterium]